MDSRPETVAQRRLRDMAHNAHRVGRLQAVQRMADQASAAGALPGGSGPAPGINNRSGLPERLKSGVESLSGYRMDDVRVHYNSARPAQLHAHAFAQGTDIHVAPGQERHLSHEAWHVVQQKQGRVRPTLQLRGRVAVNDDAGLEREATAMGQRAWQAAGAEPNQPGRLDEPRAKAPREGATVQLLERDDAVPMFALGDRLTHGNEALRVFWMSVVHRDIMKNFKSVSDARAALNTWIHAIQTQGLGGAPQWREAWNGISAGYPKASKADKVAKKVGNELHPDGGLPTNVMHLIGSFLDDRSLSTLEGVSHSVREWSLDEQLGDHHPSGTWGPAGNKTPISAKDHRRLAHAAYLQARNTPEVLLYRVPDKKKANLSRGDKLKSVSSVSPEYPWGKTPAWIQGAVRGRATFRLLSDPRVPDKLKGGEHPHADEDAVLTRELRQIVLEFGYTIHGPDHRGYFILQPPQTLPTKLSTRMDWDDTWNPALTKIGSHDRGNDRTAVIDRFTRAWVRIENLAGSKTVGPEDLDIHAGELGIHIIRGTFSDGASGTQTCMVEVRSHDEAMHLVHAWNGRMIKNLSASGLPLRVSQE